MSDEPSFTNTKIITSLFGKSLNNNLDDNFKRCVEFRDATADLLKPYKDSFDFDELGKIAIDYSDGIVQADKAVNKNLLSYAKEKEIPVLKYKNEDFAQAIEDFYNMIAPDETEEEEDD